jgi:hypothetical protein
MEKEGSRYLFYSHATPDLYVKDVNDLLLPILDILHSTITSYKCGGCLHCCYGSHDADTIWLCEFDFSKTLRGDFDTYFRFYSQHKVSCWFNMSIDKETYKFQDGWPVLDSEQVWSFDPECLKNIKKLTLDIL